VDVVCLDKTGTITTNRLSITGALPREGFASEDVIRAGALASEESNQDPIDRAFLDASRKAGLPVKDAQRVSFTPFSPETRRTEAVFRNGSAEFRVMKGALRVVGEACGRSAAEIAALEAEATLQASKGYRVLAVASSERGAGLTLVGLVMLADLPRPDSKALIADLERLGVAVKMLTGDALPVAQEMARQVGLRPVFRADELRAALAEDPRKAAGVIEASGGFAEVFPEDKFRVVQALQSAGHLAGMTGDGVNDAPALRQAEVGVAVSSATDVAKAASSVVLTTEGMTGILDVVRNGRVIYQRILTWILNKISRTILKTSFVTVAFLVTGQFVISAFGMMLLVFMTDFVKIALSTDRTRPSERPETWKIGGWVRVSVALGVVLLLEALGLLALGWHAFGLGKNLETLRTFSFLLLLSFAIFSLVSIREREAFWSTRPSRILLLALGIDQAIGLLLSVVGLPGLKPLPLAAALSVLGYSAIAALLLNDFVKRWLIRRWVRAS
jgi:magnesium-transporting ATPase (P-type)